jgi:hypothetical protein
MMIVYFPNYILSFNIQKVLNSHLRSFKKMTENFDREKIVDCMFDPITSSLLSELEEGKKQCSFLADQIDISESEVLERFSYLIEYNFIFKKFENGKYFLSANLDKLSSFMENSENFDDAINGLEKMDSYLN